LRAKAEFTVHRLCCDETVPDLACSNDMLMLFTPHGETVKERKLRRMNRFLANDILMIC